MLSIDRRFLTTKPRWRQRVVPRDPLDQVDDTVESWLDAGHTGKRKPQGALERRPYIPPASGRAGGRGWPSSF